MALLRCFTEPGPLRIHVHRELDTAGARTGAGPDRVLSRRHRDVPRRRPVLRIAAPGPAAETGLDGTNLRLPPSVVYSLRPPGAPLLRGEEAG